MTKSGDSGGDLISGLRPDERLRLLVRDREIVRDRGLELAGAAMRATPDLLLRQGREPALDQIHPRRPGRREVQVEARMPSQPATNQRGLVGPVVVQDQMDGEVGGNLGIDPVEELAKRDGAMPAVTLPDDLAALDLKR